MSGRLYDHRHLTIAAVVLPGLLLRLYRLGANSFWIDEVGVANVAKAATIREALRMAHNHVMAVPLDYIVAWLFAHLNTGEFFLRLPAVFWGTGSIVVCYFLFSDLSDRKTALLASFFLAISPIHIQYSQELRFYAALVFFYLLSNWLLIKAIDRPETSNWLQYILFTSIGIYFHFYVILSIVTGVALLWITHGRDPGYALQRKFFIRSASFVLMIFLIGLLFFGSVYNYDIPITLNNQSILTVLGIGFGWIPFYSIIPVLPWFAGLILLFLAIIGLFQSVVQKPLGRLSVLAFSIGFQILTIILFNALKRYFLAPRQFLLFLPFGLFYSATGFQWLMTTFRRKSYNNGFSLRVKNVGVFLVLIALISLPALMNYYAGDKGKIREISKILADTWQANETILIYPNYEASGYFYYWEELDTDPQVMQHTFSIEWEDLFQNPFKNETVYLIAPYPLSEEREKLLESLSFTESYLPKYSSTYSRSIWRREPID